MTLPAGLESFEGGPGIGDQAFGAAGRVRRALAQPLGCDDGGGVFGGYRGQQGVQPADPGISAAGALLGVAVDLGDRVVNID
ncbi:hypothetical protein ABIB45_002303 [Arthrobacter sp. UYCo732]